MEMMAEHRVASMPLPNTEQVSERLHICVGYSCNNNCVFCMEEDREGRYKRLINQTESDVWKMLSSNPNVKEVMFTSGEPTLHPLLPRYIRMARDAGMEVIGLITNGRMLSYMPYARLLCKSGLNHVLVSIHGPNAKVHDALTRTRGAFAQTTKGLENLALLKKEFVLKVHTSYVVNKRNFRFFKEFFDAMQPYDIDQFVFNVMMLDGRGGKLANILMPRYTEIASEFLRFTQSLAPQDVSRVFLLDIPYCTTTALPDCTRGYVERYFHFEPEDSITFSREKEEVLVEKGLVKPKAMDGDKAKYTIVTKSAHDEAVRVKRDECKQCGYNHICRGVFQKYVDLYGWDEFVPVVRTTTGKE